jgi:hypothetical protein
MHYWSTWRTIMSCAVVVCLDAAFFAQAQQYDQQITFLARSFEDISNESRERFLDVYLKEQGFTLVSALPIPEVKQEDKQASSENVKKVFVPRNPSEKLFSLGGQKSSLCSNLVMGVVEVTDGKVDAATLKRLEDALRQVQKDTGLSVFGVDGEGAHSDMSTITSGASQDAFLKTVTTLKGHAFSEQGNGTIIAILDTGVSTDQGDVGDLANVISGFRVDLINVDDIPQDDYEDYMNGSSMNKGHGTPIALTAHMVAPAAEILPIRVCNGDGQCPMSSVAIGICYAVNVAAQSEGSKSLVMNMSFSSLVREGFNPKDTLLYKLLNQVISPRVLVATEVGNKGLDLTPRYPAAFSNEGLDGLLSTSALEPYGQGSWQYVPAYYSTRGTYIDVAALGSNLFVGQHIVGDNNYRSGYSGSSFATPWVAGALALIQEANAARSPAKPLTAWEIEYCLKSTAQPPMPPVISQLEVGSGMINIAGAVDCVKNFVKP